MTNPIREQPRQFVQIWQQAGDEMEQMRRANLRNLPYRWQDVDTLLGLGDHYAGPPRTTGGLVEMQKWFMELARRQGLVPAGGSRRGNTRPERESLEGRPPRRPGSGGTEPIPPETGDL